MKKYVGLTVLAFALVAFSGCAEISSAFKTVEDTIKSPPQTLITALKVAGDFVLGILNVFLQGIFQGLLGVK